MGNIYTRNKILIFWHWKLHVHVNIIFTFIHVFICKRRTICFSSILWSYSSKVEGSVFTIISDFWNSRQVQTGVFIFQHQWLVIEPIFLSAFSIKVKILNYFIINTLYNDWTFQLNENLVDTLSNIMETDVTLLQDAQRISKACSRFVSWSF